MAKDATHIHFGEFLRNRVVARGPIAVIGREAGLSHTSLYRYFAAADPTPLNIEAFNQIALARAAGFISWDELDAAWRATPVARVPRRQWGAAAAAQAKFDRAGGNFDFSTFTLEQCHGVMRAAEKRIKELEAEADATAGTAAKKVKPSRAGG